MDRFTAILGATRASVGSEADERPIVELPFDAKERYGKARAPVRGRINGTPFRTTVAVYGGVYMLGFNKELRDAAGVSIGDEVTVEVERDDEPREVEVPAALREALEADAQAKAAFDALSYTRRREIAGSVAEAKRDETRARRLAKAIAELRASRLPE